MFHCWVWAISRQVNGARDKSRSSDTGGTSPCKKSFSALDVSAEAVPCPGFILPAIMEQTKFVITSRWLVPGNFTSACSQFTLSEAQVCWCNPTLLPEGQAKGSRDYCLFLGQFLSLLLAMLARKAVQVLGAQQNYSLVDIRWLAGGPFIELDWGAVLRKSEPAFWGVSSAYKLMGLLT